MLKISRARVLRFSRISISYFALYRVLRSSWPRSSSLVLVKWLDPEECYSCPESWLAPSFVTKDWLWSATLFRGRKLMIGDIPIIFLEEELCLGSFFGIATITSWLGWMELGITLLLESLFTSSSFRKVGVFSSKFGSVLLKFAVYSSSAASAID
jgi:hypothetical protein